jgi:hypothetical protein
VFLNDLEDHFKNLAGCPLEIVKEKLEANLHIFIEIFVLLYADDTNIFRIKGGYAVSPGSAPGACATSLFLASTNEPLYLKVIPRYV